MKADSAITLVIPSYNRAELIIETINSALNQQTPFAEIIVVDDASTDKTLKVLSQFGNKITVIASEKIGVQAARNRGVDAASTPYITLCDSDDLLEPGFVAVVSNWLLQNAECDSVYSNFVTFNQESTSPDKFSNAPSSFFQGATQTDDFCSDIPELYVKTVDYQPLFSSGVTIRKAFYQSIGGYDPMLNGVGSEDWEYTLRAVESGRTSLCMKPLVRIRRHSGNDSANKTRQLLGEVSVLAHALKFHKISEKYKLEINSAMDARRTEAFELAFGSKEYGYANTILNDITAWPKSIKFALKVTLTKIVIFMRSFTSINKLPHTLDSIK